MVVTLTEVDTEFGECGHYTCKIIRLQDVKGRHDSKFLGVDDWAAAVRRSQHHAVLGVLVMYHI
jgi:hypothetical protein